MKDQIYTAEKLQATARENAVAFALLSLAYLKKQGQSPEDFVAMAGNRLAQSWQALGDSGTIDFAQAITLNITSLGGKLQTLDGDDQRAEAVFHDWISHEQANAFGLSQEDGDAWWSVFEPIATSMSYSYSWKLDGDTIKIYLARAQQA
ncbi:hypothetical protein [Dictyobacter formicarum]|uniref:Uncharacterized protein n=1 Tax=Dictyobacter formicarum TaxID=2778368 RepID=A0ABQ3VU84_9CHLR|nr:hypothetical protein [Dictyobacter formicarum]GHO89301.1 hypothetical protein KSZ_73070 [Dictyobacter formicarum]